MHSSTTTPADPPATPAIVIGSAAAAASPFGPSPHTASLLGGGVADERATAAACKKFASRVAKYGAVPTCSVHDAVWGVARLPVLCSVLAQLMIGELPFSEHRHFVQHSLAPKLLQKGDAFMLFQERRLAVAAAAGKHDERGFTDCHKLLVFVGDNKDLELNAQRSTSVLDFAAAAACCKGMLPTYVLDVAACRACDMLEFGDVAQMSRALVNAAATYVARPGGCVTALYYIGKYLAPVEAVLQHTHACIRHIFGDADEEQPAAAAASE
ncbi:hypothetical protein COO60DRAFT_1643796 [Scenedesmus sp. NREL 46B-D3]|nr:hypothetical protein COO60DRAFT_1643796 [Scenedesmus sp. NREL 46B-D3]